MNKWLVLENKKKFKVGFLLLALSIQNCLIAQELPDHDIVLFDLVQTKQGLEVTQPKIVAGTIGYDNQRHFSADGNSIYFTRMIGENTDIWQWTSDKTYQITKTETSEYSPTLIPFEKGSLSMIQVEADGKQKLWKYTPKQLTRIFDSIEPVGYHAWSGKNIGMFILGEPHTLQVTQYGENKAKVVDQNIGRCLQKYPSQDAISYTTFKEDQSLLKLYNFQSGEITTFFELPNNTQDYVWFSDKKIISSDGSNLMSRDINASSWEKIINRTGFKLQEITRLAISSKQNKLAVVYTK